MLSQLVIRLLGLAPASLARRLGQSTRLARVFRPLVNRLVPATPTPVAVQSGHASGLRIVIDPRREKYYWTGAYESEVQDFLADHLTPGKVFWDVGAHYGFFAGLAARLVAPGGHVLALEPAPKNFERLLDTVSRNHLENVDPRRLAVGQTVGKVVLERGDTTSEWRVSPNPNLEGTLTVPCITLDALMAESGQPPDVVKIDVEGAELSVIRGGRRLFHEHRPILVVEFHTDEIDDCGALLPQSYTRQRLQGARWVFVSE
jgi:FkbM family methyltransferase